MNAALQQRIANRVRVEVAKLVQVGNKNPRPDAIDPDHKLADNLGLDSLDLFELAYYIEQALELEDARIEDECKKTGATVSSVIKASLAAYEFAHGEREIV